MDAVLKSRIYLIATTAFCSIIYATVVEASSDTYLGCYDESGTYGVFAHDSAIKITELPSSGPDGCRERCRKNLTDSYSFAGMWGGTHCYCASSLMIEGHITQVSNSFCFSSCPGAPTEFCGGSNASYIFSVYSVCSKEMYGSNCRKNCNCKENRNCTVNGVCPDDECAVGWKPSRINMNRRTCSVDINECETECNSTNSINCHNCSLALHQQCKNTYGSFECICDIGFHKASHGTCTDSDECTENRSNCTHNCTNSIGSYKCSCRTGYELDNNGHSCKDIDECQRGTSNCSNYCTNNEGSYECTCKTGFELHSDRHRCNDIDECDRGMSKCNQNCSNTIGSYKCSCYSRGYRLQNESNCIDIDECTDGSANCNQSCHNTIGNYSCSCSAGYELDRDRHRCNDIDECDRGTSKCNQNCSNTVGSYRCSCYTSGYQLQNEFSCIDVNECAVGNGGCQYYCNNTAGSFVCSCWPGYRIAVRSGESYNCTEVDECAEGTSGCDHECKNTIGGYNCSCHSGFQLTSDLKKCIDVDECMYDTHNCHQICHNQLGNYSCSCDAGFYLIGAFDCMKDSSSIILGLGIGNGIQSFIIVFLVATVVVLLKRKWTAKAKTRENTVELDAYAALDKRAQSANAEDQPESVYTAIIPPDETHYGNYVNVGTD